MPNSFSYVRGDRLAEARQAERRAVVRLAVVDGLDAGLEGVRGAGERAVADLQLDDVLALGLEPLGDGQHVEGGFGGQAAGEGGQGRSAHGGLVGREKKKAGRGPCPATRLRQF